MKGGAGLVVLGGKGLAGGPLADVLPLTDAPPEGRAGRRAVAGAVPPAGASVPAGAAVPAEGRLAVAGRAGGWLPKNWPYTPFMATNWPISCRKTVVLTM